MKLNAGAKVGLIIGLIGGIVGLVSAFLTEPIVGVIITAVMVFVFLFIFRVIVKPSMEYSRILKTGTQSMATIVSISETGTRINDQPLVVMNLKVTPAIGESYVTSTKTVISFLQASQLVPGTQIPIMVDAVDKMKVVLIKQGDAPANFNATPEQMEELKLKLEEMNTANEAIRANGIYCRAIVTKYTPSGVNVNGDNPLVTMEVQVLPESEPAFEATVKCVIKSTSIPLYQPGEEIFVKYDQFDKTKVAVEHS